MKKTWTLANKFLSVWILATCFFSPETFSMDIHWNARPLILGQSQMVPYPQYGIDLRNRKIRRSKTMAATLVSGVPPYLWRHGSGPTAVGMILGYYDSHGYPSLIPGESINQGENVNLAIASNEHYADYCLPLDSPPILLKDKSEPPPGDEHPNNCVADHMKTSQSYHRNYYAWTWSVDIEPGFEDYVNSAGRYTAFAATYPFDDFSWAQLTSEIDNDRPMAALVDVDGDNVADHFITIIGYKSDGGLNYYGCFNTWDKDIHWYPYQDIDYGKAWGAFCFYSFRLFAGLFPPKNVKLQQLENDFIFFKEMINRISLEADDRNQGIAVKHRIYRKNKDATDDDFELAAELNEDQTVFEDRGLRKTDAYIYRIIAIDIKTARESMSVEISN